MLAAALLCSVSVFAQLNWLPVQGNGHVKKETRDVGSFKKLHSSGSWDVMIAYGSKNTVEVEGDENLLEYIETKVEDGELRIKAAKRGNLRSRNKITIYVTMNTVNGIALSGSGDIIGNGNFSAEGTTQVKISGSGNIRFQFKRFGDVTAAVSGSGNLQLKGNAQSCDAQVSGSGDIDAGELFCEAAKARVSGSGNIRVNTSRSLEARISGSGNIYYKGGAGDITAKSSGSGKVIKG